MGADQLLSRQVVQRRGQALGQASAVDEDERRAVGAHELQQPGMDRGPDGAASDGARRSLDDLIGAAALGRGGQGLAQARHVLDRDLDLQVEGLALGGIDDRHRARTPRPRALAAAEIAGDLVERTLRCGQPHPLRRPPGDLGEALEREGEMRATLGPDEGVDLVHDHQLDRGQHCPRPRGQDEEERFRRRDEDVGRVARHAGALGGRRVACAQRDLGPVERDAAELRGPGDADDRRPQVPLDVEGERPQRRDVDDAAPFRPRRGRAEHEPVDRGQERGQRLARARGREHERRAAGRDLRPREPLGPGRAGERPGEPLFDRGMERHVCQDLTDRASTRPARPRLGGRSPSGPTSSGGLYTDGPGKGGVKVWDPRSRVPAQARSQIDMIRASNYHLVVT